ncbi:molybdopterin-guanine dinucleotide biosynthesis protein B [Thermoproteota archaeon]
MFGRVIIAVVGNSNSGKTTAIETIIKGLTKKGYTVASTKRIPEPEFSIDTQGKDTWRHAKAGANPILSVAPNELSIIKKVDTKKYTLFQIIAEIPDEVDIIIIEGFKSLVGEKMAIPKIVAIRNINEVSTAIERYNNILAFIGNIPDGKVGTDIPFVNVLNEPEKLVDLVNKKVEVLVERKRKQEEKITINVNEKMIPLGSFVQNIVRNTVLGIVSSLKGVNAEFTRDLTKVKIIITTDKQSKPEKTGIT